MVTTRRKANLDAGQPATAPAAAAPAPRRRLRGDASASPLQSLTADRKPSGGRGRRRARAPNSTVAAAEQPEKNVAAPSGEEEGEQPVFVQIEQNELENLRALLATKTNTIDVLVADRQKLRDEIATLRLENDRLRESAPRKIATPRSIARKAPTPAAATPNAPEPRAGLTPGEELLQRIEARRLEDTPAEQEDAEGADDVMEVDDEEDEDEVATLASTVQAQTAQTPQTPGWGLRDMFGFVASVFRPQAPAPAIIVPPATAPPRPLNASQAQALTNSLTPDTPTHAPAKRRNASRRNTTSNGEKPSKKKKKSDKPVPDRRAIITRVTQSITDKTEKASAMAWAKEQAAKLAQDPETLGDKRKRMEETWTLKDISEIPACKPWQTGTFAFMEEFFDDSDDEEAEVPEWMKLYELTKDQPPAKKRKTNTQSPSLTDSQGHSTSLRDLHPRSSTIPSPMFDNTPTHSPNTNVFNESQTKPDSERFSHFLEGKSFHMPGISAPSKTITVPDSSSEDEQAWTQPPPPPPAPAHASLPVPLTSAPSVPAMPAAQSSMFASAESSDESSDPVKTQRLHALKHTPAKASRLREVMLPSPSDSGSPASLLAAAGLQNGSPLFPVSANGPAVYDMPAAIPLDLDADILERAQEIFQSAEFKQQYADKYIPPPPRSLEQLLYESDLESDSSLENESILVD